MEEFIQALEDGWPGPSGTDVSERWEHLRDTIYNTAMSTVGKRQVKSGEWFEAYSEEMLSLIGEKSHALATYKSCMIFSGNESNRMSESKHPDGHLLLF